MTEAEGRKEFEQFFRKRYRCSSDDLEATEALGFDEDEIEDLHQFFQAGWEARSIR